jgi:hypothetical protein
MCSDCKILGSLSTIIFIMAAFDLNVRSFELYVPALCGIVSQSTLSRLRCLDKSYLAVTTYSGQ